jgi:ubiquinone/menaquinone biosynthesis C-methylase UbiE
VLDRTSAEATLDLLPAYLRDVYGWAYLTPWLASCLDRQIVVQTILWGNAHRLIGDVLAEMKPGDRVFQPAAVYGDFSRQIADKIGPQGRLEVRDIAPLQVDLTRRKLADRPQALVSYGDAATPDPDEESADVVACFFLLHEVPDQVKLQITRSMLELVAPGGKAVFVDYHRPHRFHPLKPLMQRIFDWLEPFAPSMWLREIRDLGGATGDSFHWRKRTRFGGMYQIVVAERYNQAVASQGNRRISNMASRQ